MDFAISRETLAEKHPEAVIMVHTATKGAQYGSILGFLGGALWHGARGLRGFPLVSQAANTAAQTSVLAGVVSLGAGARCILTKEAPEIKDRALRILFNAKEDRAARLSYGIAVGGVVTTLATCPHASLGATAAVGMGLGSVVDAGLTAAGCPPEPL